MWNWQKAAHEAVAQMALEAQRQAGKTKNGKQKSYELPEAARKLVDALGNREPLDGERDAIEILTALGIIFEPDPMRCVHDVPAMDPCGLRATSI